MKDNKMKYYSIITEVCGSIDQQNFTNYTYLDGATFPAKNKDSESYNLYPNWGRTDMEHPYEGQCEVTDKQKNSYPLGYKQNNKEK